MVRTLTWIPLIFSELARINSQCTKTWPQSLKYINNIVISICLTRKVVEDCWLYVWVNSNCDHLIWPKIFTKVKCPGVCCSSDRQKHQLAKHTFLKYDIYYSGCRRQHCLLLGLTYGHARILHCKLLSKPVLVPIQQSERNINKLFPCERTSNFSENLLWAGRHDRARSRYTKLCYCAIQHIDLIKEIHGYRIKKLGVIVGSHIYWSCLETRIYKTRHLHRTACLSILNC